MDKDHGGNTFVCPAGKEKLTRWRRPINSRSKGKRVGVSFAGEKSGGVEKQNEMGKGGLRFTRSQGSHQGTRGGLVLRGVKHGEITARHR